MSSEEVFVQQFATLFVHYRHALTLESIDENGAELRELSDLPVVELDRMVSAARLALLEIETNARENDVGRNYYAKTVQDCNAPTSPSPDIQKSQRI